MVAGSVTIAALLAANSALAGGYSVLHSFSGPPDGTAPGAALIRDNAGNLYGTTFDGGTGTNCLGGCGTVFEIAANGIEAVLYSFQGDTDGAGPASRLIEDKAGNLYGTTEYGGGGVNCTQWGTVFELAPNRTETILNQFVSGTDGAGPEGDIVMDSKGNIYGTTGAGGGSTNCTNGCGTVYEVVKGGDETVLHAFRGSDGSMPSTGLVVDAKGNFYGATQSGGSKNYGTLFELAHAQGAWTEKVLDDFKAGRKDGALPSGLFLDSAEDVFGTTVAGGTGVKCSVGCGTVFELPTGGTERILHSFPGTRQDGAFAAGDLVQDVTGNLYGTTLFGGSKGSGTVFKLASDGTVTVLHSFGAQAGDGVQPAGVIADSKGRLYGATGEGGASTNCTSGFGTIFRINE